ncbi:MAG: nitroreductase family protein [Methylophilaceae bacterium]
MQKPAITQESIHDLIANRWSPRAFDASKPVNQEQVIALLEAARWAPSCFGDQPWRFLVWNKNQDAAAWQHALDVIVPNNQVWSKNAPVLILVCAYGLFGHNQKPNRWSEYDTGAAAENLCLQASALGLVAHQMGGFESDAARARFNIPADVSPMAMLAIGYEGDSNDLPEELKTRELAQRSRKPLGELFFNGVWDKPII